MTHVCNHCGSVHEEAEMHLFAGEWYCNDCWEDEDVFLVCADCGERFFATDGNISVYNDVYGHGDDVALCDSCREDYYYCNDCDCLVHCDDGYFIEGPDYDVCPDCLANHYTLCEHCGHHVHNDYINHLPNGEYWCDSCYEDDTTSCERCGDAVPCDDATCIEGYGDVCDDCRRELNANEDIFRCDDCRTWYWENDYIQHITDDGCLCSSCYQRRRRNTDREEGSNEPTRDGYHDYDRQAECTADDVIYGYHSYNGVHRWVPRRADNEPISLPLTGIEWEIEGGGTYNYKAVTLLKALNAYDDSKTIVSRDGSLTNGIEFVSDPASYYAHMSLWNYEAFCKKAKELGYRSHDGGNCGLHFHLDRKFFEGADVPIQSALTILLINNKEWFAEFSRRNNFRYCDFPGETTRCRAKKMVFKDLTHILNIECELRGHGRAMNFANSPTVEIRFIRGTLKYHTFVASLQLVQLMAWFCKNYDYDKLTKVDINSFVAKATEFGWVEFAEYLDERHIGFDHSYLSQSA